VSVLEVIFPAILIMIIAYVAKSKAELVAKIIKVVAGILFAFALVFIIVMLSPLADTSIGNIMRQILSIILAFFDFIESKFGVI